MLPILLTLGFAIYALVDCISSKDEEIKHLPKLVWVLLIVVAPLIGPLAWIIVGRERAVPGRGARRGGGGWVAPDDNPEFLRSLGEIRRRDGLDGQEGQDRPAASDGERDGRQDAQGRPGAADQASGADEQPPGERDEDLRRREEESRQQEGRDGGEDGGGPSDTPPGKG